MHMQTARKRAQELLGTYGDFASVQKFPGEKTSVFGLVYKSAAIYTVGYYKDGNRIVVGRGLDWEEALENTKRAIDQGLV